MEEGNKILEVKCDPLLNIWGVYEKPTRPVVLERMVIAKVCWTAIGVGSFKYTVQNYLSSGWDFEVFEIRPGLIRSFCYAILVREK
jgi:hypothetical protein